MILKIFAFICINIGIFFIFMAVCNRQKWIYLLFAGLFALLAIPFSYSFIKFKTISFFYFN